MPPADTLDRDMATLERLRDSGIVMPGVMSAFAWSPGTSYAFRRFVKALRATERRDKPQDGAVDVQP